VLDQHHHHRHAENVQPPQRTSKVEEDDEDRKRTILILADDDHIYWKGALSQMEQQFTKDWNPRNNNDDQKPLTAMAMTFHAYTLNHLRIGQGADLLGLALSQLQFETTLRFYECIVHHQPRLWWHDDAWISLMLRVQNISITTLRSIDSPWKGHMVYQKANPAMGGLYDTKTKGYQRQELQQLVKTKWQPLAKLCGNTVLS
jgi:hypothetical protein